MQTTGRARFSAGPTKIFLQRPKLGVTLGRMRLGCRPEEHKEPEEDAISQAEIVGLIARSMKWNQALTVLREAAGQLELDLDSLRYEQVQKLLDHLARRSGMVGTSARLAKTRLALLLTERRLARFHSGVPPLTADRGSEEKQGARSDRRIK